MRESKDRQSVRCSLRSNPPYAVSPVAEAFGGGGGHRQAAGCTFPGDLAAALQRAAAAAAPATRGLTRPPAACRYAASADFS